MYLIMNKILFKPNHENNIQIRITRTRKMEKRNGLIKNVLKKRKAFNKARNVFIRNKSNVNKLEYPDKNACTIKQKEITRGSLSAPKENE